MKSAPARSKDRAASRICAQAAALVAALDHRIDVILPVDAFQGDPGRRHAVETLLCDLVQPFVIIGGGDPAQPADNADFLHGYPMQIN